MTDKKIHLRIIVNTIICLAGAILLITLLPKAIMFFLPFVIASIVSAMANPLISFLEKRVKILRKHSSAILIVFVIAVILGLFTLLGFAIFHEVKKLYDDMANIGPAITKFVDDLEYSLSDFSSKLPKEIQSYFENFDEKLEEGLLALANKIFDSSWWTTAGNYLGRFGDVLVMVIMTVLASYFLTANHTKHAAFLVKHTSPALQQSYHMVMDNIKTAVGGYFKAQFKIMFILIFIMFIIFSFMKIKYAFLIALGIAMLDFLPIFGTGLILGPWSIFCLINANYLTGILLIIVYVVCQVVKQLLQPKMVGDSIGISPLTTLFFMFLGFQLNGVIGLIIGIPVGMILVNFYRMGAFNRLIKGFRILINDINQFRKF